jgi:hypothetical protein
MADSKITALPPNTTPVATDLLVIVDDPSGAAATQKITVEDLSKTDSFFNYAKAQAASQVRL